MNCIEGLIFDIRTGDFIEGKLFFSNQIERIVPCTVSSKMIILPGLIDSHVHIESSMLSPLQYSMQAIKHGVISAVTDPHEIANVCGISGIQFMIESADKSPMKIYFGIPSCVPATEYETSGEAILSNDIAYLFKNGNFTHLSEMMNFPGVIYNNPEVCRKIEISKQLGKPIDGHAPLLSGEDLIKYVSAGISTDHECTSIPEAIEKIKLGMKILLRNSSASKDFDVLLPLINSNPNDVMLCTDDCHPDDLVRGYINSLFKRSLDAGFELSNIVQASTMNAVNHYKLDVGLLQIGDPADFIIVDSLADFNILSTYIDGVEVWDGTNFSFDPIQEEPVNQFYHNFISEEMLHVKRSGTSLKVIGIIPDSLLTESLQFPLNSSAEFIETSLENDILKLVVLNRYSKAVPAIAFIKGFQLKKGAIASTIAHDSHNIIAVGVDDASIVKAIQQIQAHEGGLCVTDGDSMTVLPLPIAGLMSLMNAEDTAMQFTELLDISRSIGCTLKSPFMTLGFMSLLVIPHLKLSDQGLFDGDSFQFTSLQN